MRSFSAGPVSAVFRHAERAAAMIAVIASTESSCRARADDLLMLTLPSTPETRPSMVQQPDPGVNATGALLYPQKQ